jgi:CRP-like cAMP-binding protein
LAEIVLTLTKNQRNRTAEDLENLMIATESVFFFQKLRDDNEGSTSEHRACCKVMEYETFAEGQYVMKYGERGTKFYIILNGKVKVLVPNLETPLIESPSKMAGYEPDENAGFTEVN